MIFNDNQADIYKMSFELTLRMMKPILHWVSNNGEISPEETLLANIHMASILSCMCTLEHIFGEEVLRKYMEEAKQKAMPFTAGDGTIH